MPTTQASIPTFPDHRIFGYDTEGRLRVNLYNGPDQPEAGAFYSWITRPTIDKMIETLASWDDPAQPMTAHEIECVEDLEASIEPQPCQDCGGTGIAVGGLSAFEPEACGTCKGTGEEPAPESREEDEPAVKRIPAVVASAQQERAA